MKFKELLGKIQEKNEFGKPETTKNYASATPGQGNVVFTPDTKYDGVALAKELDPSGGIQKQIDKAKSNMDIDADGDVDAMDKKNDTIPDEVTGAEKKNRTLDLLKKGAKERAHTKKGVAYESMDLKKAKMGDVIKDFQKSDAPQFAGKSDEKKREMAIAAKLQADRDVKEAADQGYWTVVYKDKNGKAGAEKNFDNEASAKKHAERGNAVDKVGGKYHVYHVKGRMDEQAPVAPTLDRKYIKGTPEWKAHKEKNKPINGHPTNTTKEEVVYEGKDDREYGYEGDMAISQLKTIVRHADHMMGMLKPETDLPEWVQSKITLSTDYMQTAHDYMMSEMTEAYESRVHGRITSAEVHKVLGPTKNAAEGITALKKAFKVNDQVAKSMMDKVMKESTESLEEATDKTLDRLRQLVRFGLMDKSKLPLLTRAYKSMEDGKVTNPQERSALFELLNELIGLVTGDDAMFAKVRMNVQKEEVEQIDEKKSDYTIHHDSYSSAVQHAVDHTNKTSGFTVDPDHYDRSVATGPRKPSEGKTNSFNLTLLDKNGKESKKKLHMQVYGMGNGKYELNKYVA